MEKRFWSVNDVPDFAIAREVEANQFYTALAGEEAKHKLRFEIEYDDYVLKES